MDFNEYKRLAMLTSGKTDLACAGLGITGEAGEVADIIKKHLYHGHKLNIDSIKKELGDCCWYIALICELLNIDFNEVAKINIEKLNKRYPTGFSESLSINRSDK